MQQPIILQRLSNISLTESDIKAICQSRGFSVKEVSSRPIFENFLLSDIGVAEALKKLSESEILLLHRLKSIDKVVNIAFFQPQYDPQPVSSWNHRTFTQRNQKTLQEVKQSLVRRGVLIMTEEYQNFSETTCKLERWRFRFPREFAKHLPYPFKAVSTFPKPCHA